MRRAVDYPPPQAFAGQRFVLRGIPRTKKNHGQVIMRGGRRFHVPSEAHREWEELALLQLRSQWRRGPLASRVNMCALVYRDRDVGDLLNYLAAVSDALERAAVLLNDRQIVSVDGSRLLKDAADPRVEILLAPAP